MFKKINTKIEKLFDQPNFEFNFDEIRNNYEPINDNNLLENLSYIFSTSLKKENLVLLFTQLSSYFEVGFLLEKSASKNISTPMQVFAYSKNLNQINGLSSIKLPNTELYEVLQTNSKNFLKKFHLEALDPKNKFNAFLIRISDTHSIVIMSALAEPWLKLRLESLQKTLMRVHFDL